MRTHLDSASTRRTSPAPERTSSAGGTPRAWHQNARQAQAVRLGPSTRPHIKRRRYASGPAPDRTSSAGGTPRAQHQTARQAQAVRLGPSTRPHVRHRWYASGPAPDRTSGTGGTPRAWRMATQDSSPFTVDCPAPASRQVTTQPTRCVHPSRWRPPPSIPMFPHQQAENSLQNQHVLFFNVPSACRRSSRRFRVCSCYWVRCTRSVGITPLLFGCSAT